MTSRPRPDRGTAAAQAEARREQARAQFEAACDELRSSEGWLRFAKARALLRGYSLNNTMLILAQRPEATTVASYRRWLELGRQVRRGEQSLRIWAPSVRRERDESTGEETTSVRAFVLVPVFDVSQTEGPPLPEPPPVTPLTGDSHAHLLLGLEQGASEAGYAVERREAMPGQAQGFVDHERRVIALSSALEPNGQVAVLVHELAHVHGARYRAFGRAGAEVIAETAAHIALSATRLDTRAQSVPYVSGWADAAPKELADYADAVHRIAATLERGLGLKPDARILQLSVRDGRAVAGRALSEPAARDAHVRAR
jgi:antirestriction protein ArdC